MQSSLSEDNECRKKQRADHPLACTADPVFSGLNMVRYMENMRLGQYKGRPRTQLTDYTAAIMPSKFKETEFKLGSINKVFASQWLNDSQVVFGTKCNKLFVQDVYSHQRVSIPMLRSSRLSCPAEPSCGIHSIALNPSKTYLATGADHVNDLAIYKLPTLDPVCVGEGGHGDWIFDIEWLDDKFLVTGSRDTNLALWRIPDEDETTLDVFGFPTYSTIQPVSIRKCRQAEKIRALCYNDKNQEIATISLDAKIHMFDAQTFKQKFTKKLPFCLENVCIATSEDCLLYAVGSKSHVAFLDARTLKPMTAVISKQRGCGIRSLSFRGNIVTIGTGNGAILFYDVRSMQYLECNCCELCKLSPSKGWLRRDEIFREVFMEDDGYTNAIYTHCYDTSGANLFTAGGPLPAGLYGNYAGLWS